MPEKSRQTSEAWLIAEYSVRSLIMKVHTLRKTIEDEAALRRNHPEDWRRRDRQRRARNREQAQLNRELVAAGCRPGAPEPSLKGKLRKLRKLQVSSRAEIARFRMMQ